MPFHVCIRAARWTAVAALLAFGAGASASEAAPKRAKTVTYRVALNLDARNVTPPFTSTETVTADFVARPSGGAAGAGEPTAWTGQGTLNFGPIVNSGLPGGCTLTTTPPTGTMNTSLTGSGGSLNVNWSTNTSPIGASTLVCQGVAAPFSGAPAVEPFLLLEPKQYTISAEGGSQPLSGRFDAAHGMIENTGTMTISKRVECEPKVKQVNTSPPGQQTQLSSMAGRGFSPGEKLTADTNLEFVFPDGSVMRLAKGSSYQETDDCGAMQDKSKSFKGTLLLGKAWFNISKVFGGTTYEPDCPLRCIVGVRGTKFWTSGGRRSAKVTVARGSVWFSRVSGAGKLVGRKVTVKAGETAVMNRRGAITVRRSRSSDAFAFTKR